MQYEMDKLRQYINSSELIVINDNLKIRLSKELLENFKTGLYSDEISFINDNINEIKKLDIKYPANANPVFYLYIVPNNNFKELLNVPVKRFYKTGCGKPVSSYDLDGFNNAFGLSSNILENRSDFSIMRKINSIHELAHLVHSMFFNKERYINEGFAEAFTLYTMDYESKFDEHRKLLSSLKENQILSANELIELSNTNQFDTEPLIPNKSVSFETPYISSYLFIRGCIEKIEDKFSIDRV